jgi:hypothetical protein
MQSILISTRKGLFIAEPSGSGYKVTRGAFVGDNVSIAMVDPRPNGGWYAALDHGHFGVKLHRSDDKGATWTEITTPAYPPKPEGQVEKTMWGKDRAWSTLLIWAMAPATDKEGALWAGTVPGGLFRSDDRGQTWRLNEALWFHPDRQKWNGVVKEEAGIHSICVDPRDPKMVAVGVSTGGVWRTKDGGATWTQSAHGMRAEYVPPELVNDGGNQDVHYLVQCAADPKTFWVQHSGCSITTASSVRPMTWRRGPSCRRTRSRRSSGLPSPRIQRIRTRRGSCRHRRTRSAFPSRARSSCRARAMAARRSRCSRRACRIRSRTT